MLLAALWVARCGGCGTGVARRSPSWIPGAQKARRAFPVAHGAVVSRRCLPVKCLMACDAYPPHGMGESVWQRIDRSGGDAAVARLDPAVDAICDQSQRDQAEQEGAEGQRCQGRQRASESLRLA